MPNVTPKWTPANVDAFERDFKNRMTNLELASRHKAKLCQVEHYLRGRWQEGSLVRRSELAGAVAEPKKKPPSQGSTEEFDERSMDGGGNISIDLQTSKVKIETLDDLIEHCRIDLGAYEILSYNIKAWDMGVKAQETDEDGKTTAYMETKKMFAVNAKLRPRKEVFDLRGYLKEMIDEARDHMPQAWPIYDHPSDHSRRHLLELSITDAHFGKLAWWKESGESYDLKIAEDVFREAVADLLEKSKGYHFEEILFVVGNDLFNADNRNNTTFAGTPQSTDVRYQKTFTTVRRVIQDVVEQLLRPRAKRVRILMVSGNHDTETVFMFGEVLDAYFHNCEDVIVDNQPTQRKYAEFGQVMLLFTHGSEEKHTDLPLIMAQERPEMWGRTRYREVHLGHYHKRKSMNWVGVDEHKGVAVRILPSLCAAEDWHTSRGYIGNMRSAEAYVWDAELGLCATFLYTVPPFVKTTP